MFKFINFNFIKKNFISNIQHKIKKFFLRFIYRSLIYIFFILPIILISKSLYLCFLDNNLSILYFLNQLTNNIPFIKYILPYSKEWFNLEIFKNIDIDELFSKNINELLFIGGIAGSLGWSIFESFFNEFFKERMIISGEKNFPIERRSNPINIINIATLDKEGTNKQKSNVLNTSSSNKESKLDSVKGKKPEITSAQKTPLDIETQVFMDILADEVKKDTQNMIEVLLFRAKELKGYRDIPLDNLELGKGVEETLIRILQDQSNTLTKYVTNRMTWLQSRALNALEENQIKIKEIHSKIIEIQKNYSYKVKLISKIENETVQIKEFYATLNEYRNIVLKEVNKGDTIILKDIKESRLNKYSDLKKAIITDYNAAKKEFNSNDSYLRMKVGEIINRKKD